MNVSIIVAVDKKGGISKNGQIPWQIKEDMNFFIDVTKREYKHKLKNILIMGKNTWLACRDTLKNREIIVISSTVKVDDYANTYLSSTYEEALKMANDFYNNGKIGHIFICGGSQIYKESFNHKINTIYLTTIDYDYECDNCIDINLNYNTFATNTFKLVDLNDQKEINVTFQKLYLTLPDHWQWTEERQYLNLLNDVLTTGDFRQTRNSKTWSKFGKTLEFDLSKGFPLLTSKKCNFFGAFQELLFMIQGKTNTTLLSELGVKFWDGNTSREFLDSVGLNHYEIGTMGTAYGFQLRHFNAKYIDKHTDYTAQGFDQINYCINLLKTDPYSRRIMMTTYNPAQASTGCLTPCHGTAIIFNIELKNKLYYLSCMMTQRSADLGSGFYLNICEYALQVYMLCEIINNDPNYTSIKFAPGRLIINLGDTHIYESHYSQAIRQLLRDPYKLPQLKINRKVTELIEFKFEDFELIDYNPYPGILCKMVV